MIYVIHFCKNKACNKAWLDKDLFNAVEPPRWRYCQECKGKGFKDRLQKQKELRHAKQKATA